MGATESAPIITFERLRSLLDKAKSECKTEQDWIIFEDILSSRPYGTSLYRHIQTKYEEDTGERYRLLSGMYSGESMYYNKDYDNKVHRNSHFLDKSLQTLLQSDPPKRSRVKLYSDTWNALVSLCQENHLIVKTRSC